MRGTYLEYAENRIRTTTKETPLTIADNPTLTICFHGQNASSIEYNYHFKASYTYTDGSGHIISMWDLDETSVKKLILSIDTSVRRSCFMLKRLEVDIGDN